MIPKVFTRHAVLLCGAAAFASCFAAVANTTANTVQFEPNAYGIAENAGAASVTLTVTARRTDPSAVITVQYNSANGSATAGSDYTQMSGTLTFNANETQ